jgi:hypothetical protein
MFDEIKSQFINGLSEQTWMDYSTRKHARLKVGGRSYFAFLDLTLKCLCCAM